MAVLPAHLVATPVLERIDSEQSGVVLGAGATAAWVDLDGFVVAVTTREVPLLPNAVALGAGSGALARPGLAQGARARLLPGRMELGPLHVTWDPSAPPAWDPTVPVSAAAGREDVARRGTALREALAMAPGAVDNRHHPLSGSGYPPGWGPIQPRVGVSPARGPEQGRVGVSPARGPEQGPWVGVERAPHPPHDPDPAVLVGELARIGLSTATGPAGGTGLQLLFRAVRERDPEPAAAATRGLLGRGPGLTPEGDDLLAAVAGTVAVLGPARGWDEPVLRAFLGAVVGPARARTTALSATRLELAARGRLAEPAGRLLDLGPGGEAAWPAAVARLERLGHGSGRAYAAGIAATTSLLGAGSRNP
jgi:Protein of unknown function (DUF2877)